MEENVVFKTAAVGGFEKRAVLDYIYQLNEDTEKEKQVLQERIAELEALVQNSQDNSRSVNNNVSNLEREIATINNALKEEQQAKQAALKINEDLKKEVKHYQDIAGQKEKELQEFIQKNRSVLDKNRELEAKQEELDKASYQLGRVMLDARTDADNIVTTANEQAKEILAKATAEATKRKAEAEKESATLIEQTQAKVHKDLENARNEQRKIQKDTEEFAEYTLATAKQEAAKLMDSVRERAGNVVRVSKEMADTSGIQLDMLKEDTAALRAALQDTLQQLQDKTEVLDKVIETANKTLKDESVALANEELLSLPDLDIDALQNQYRNHTPEPVMVEEPAKLAEYEPEIVPELVMGSQEAPIVLTEEPEESMEEAQITTTESVLLLREEDLKELEEHTEQPRQEELQVGRESSLLAKPQEEEPDISLSHMGAPKKKSKPAPQGLKEEPTSVADIYTPPQEDQSTYPPGLENPTGQSTSKKEFL